MSVFIGNNHPGGNAVRAAVVMLAVLCLTSGCSMLWHGTRHAISQQDVDSIKIGVTTRAQVIALLGKPQQILHKASGVEVLIYTHGVEKALAFPFLITIGRAGGSGQTLSVTMNDGIVIDRDYTVDQRDVL